MIPTRYGYGYEDTYLPAGLASSKIRGGRQGYVLGSGELEFRAIASQCPFPVDLRSRDVSQKNLVDEGEVRNGEILFENDAWGASVGEPSQLPLKQVIQRSKHSNCGGLVPRKWNTMDLIYGSQEQMEPGPTAISSEIEGSHWHVPETEYTVFDCVTDQVNRKPNFQPELTGLGFSSSTSFLPNRTVGNAVMETPITNDRMSIWNPVSPAQPALSSVLGAMTNRHNAVSFASSHVNVGEHHGHSQATFLGVNSTHARSDLEGRSASYPPFGSNFSLPMGSTGETTQFSVTGSVGCVMGSPGNFHDHISGSRRSSCKRKRSTIGIPDSLPFRPSHCSESNFARFTDGRGPTRFDTGNSAPEVFHSATSAPRVHNHYDTGIALKSGRGNPVLSGPNGSSNRYVRGRLSHMQQEPYEFHPFSMQNNRRSVATMPSETWRSRGVESAANMNNTILPDQVCSYPLTGPWCANNNRTTLPGPVREFTHGNFEENRVRSSNGVSSWIGITNVDNQLSNQTTYDFPGRATFAPPSRAFNTRQSHSHSPHVGANAFTYPGTVALESPAQLSTALSSRRNNYPSQGHLLSPAISAAPDNLMIGPQPMSVDGSPSPAFVHGPCNSAMPSLLLDGHTGGGLASSMQSLLRMPFRRLQILPADRGSRHHFVSEEFFDQSLGYNRVDIHDQYGDMRLDVDNMSYEELLALEERIGNVSTGLSDETMAKCLKTSKYSSSDITIAVATHESDIKCSICQEEYVEEDELGQLDCGHSYHSTCIKQWLVQKNQCPICKSAACASS